VDVAAFGTAWLADVKGTAPERLGPQPAPSGPLPPAWGGSAGGTGASLPGNPPGWMAPLLAGLGVVVVIVLLLAARRSRPSPRVS